MKPSFLSPLIVTPFPKSDTLWALRENLCYRAGDMGGAYSLVTVPKGFVTDYASVPRIFWRVLIPSGLGREAAVIHDWLYSCGDREKHVADAFFFEGMQALNVPAWRKWAMYLAVALFGGPAWKSHRRAGHTVNNYRKA